MTLLTIHQEPTHLAPHTTNTSDSLSPADAPGSVGTADEADPQTANQLSDLLFDTHHHDHAHDQWRALISRKEFRYTPNLTDTERIALSYTRLRLINDHVDPETLARDPGRLAALHEWTGFTDGGLCTLISIHYNLFLGSLLDHQDPAHPRNLADFTTLKRTGTFLCTELDHGNDAANLQTIADYNPHTQQFTLNTPTPGAQKFMPNTSLTGGPKTGLVAARLISDGHDLGVHLFLTPLSDENGLLPGVTVRPLPTTNGPLVDHSLTSFDHVALPHNALLQAPHSRLQPNGAHRTTLGNKRKRFLTTINRVTTGKLCMSAASLGMARAALTHAVHHAHTRHTTGPRPDQHIPLAAHRTHASPLLSKIAQIYAMTFLHRTTVSQHSAHTAHNKTDIERQVALTKAWITWQARDITTEARERCGAQGLFPHNGIADLTRNIEGAITAEGDNLVIWTKAAAEMILTPHTHPAPKATECHDTPRIDNPHHPSHRHHEAHRDLTNPIYLRNLLAYTETIWHTRARTALRQGPARNPIARWNHTAPHALQMISAHTRLQAADAFITALHTATHQPAKALLSRLCTLYLLNEITAHTGDLLTHHHLTPDHIEALPATTNHMIHTLTPHLRTLTQAFNHPTDLRPMSRYGTGVTEAAGPCA
ncbi:acyl-CoA dehydrogenase [Streptomyces sp. S.PNR 29]|uniref:acyl-CoA dehydrogenase family protein n=1 Tax=Streptomyces sp. S.PNR 29 TaxID=2973805 RepID=UPI0025B276A4|nr:acyl-CoA dehydrogenase [Streptomyces sp. S.PNR 29]MDN0197918.1 acyl-CoA dehydrogenase family protein [Streptomyces sp. S.PNR 29]